MAVADYDTDGDMDALVLNLEATTQLDTTSVDVLTDLVGELRKRDISLYLARVLHRVQGVMERSGLVDLVGPDHFWHSISQGVRAARKHTGLKGKGAKAAGAAADDTEDLAGADEESVDDGVYDEVESVDDERPGDDGSDSTI